jgi:hypothetical protein
MSRRTPWFALAVVGALAVTFLALSRSPRPDAEARLPEFLAGHAPVTRIDFPGSGPSDSVFNTSYSWQEEYDAVVARARTMFRAEDGWFHRYATGPYGPEDTFVYNRPEPPRWFWWVPRRSACYPACYVSVLIQAMKTTRARIGQTSTIEFQKDPWVTVQVEDFAPPHPPRAIPTSLPREATVFHPSPRRKGEKATSPF